MYLRWYFLESPLHDGRPNASVLLAIDPQSAKNVVNRFNSFGQSQVWGYGKNKGKPDSDDGGFAQFLSCPGPSFDAIQPCDEIRA